MPRLIRFLSLTVLLVSAVPLTAAEWQISVSFPQSLRNEPYTGRIYVFTSTRSREPRRGPNWFNPEPFFARDVENLKPGESVTFSSQHRDEFLTFQQDKKPVDLAGRTLQAVARFNSWEREVGDGPGNGFSNPFRVPSEVPDDYSTALELTKLVPEKKFPESGDLKKCSVRSDRMSTFYGRDVSINAGVKLPPGYADHPDKRYPVIFVIPGFGSTYFEAGHYLQMYEAETPGVEFIRVLLGADCPEGHHVFADSANNGPWGTALVEDFLPAFDKRFRTVAARDARFLTGHSSGGWSSLWLMVTHPETFAGTWSTSPDSVTFSDFSGIDMYAAGANVYRDADGNRRPLAHAGNRILFYYDTFDHMEFVLGHGGQLRSFEAVFGPKGEKGPVSAWSRTGGAVVPSTIEHWKQYDIRRKIKREWKSLKPQLAGRLHVHMGDDDTFYLAGASQLLKETLTELGEPQAVVMHAGKTHMNLLSRALMQQIHNEMAAHFRKAFTDEAGDQ